MHTAFSCPSVPTVEESAKPKCRCPTWRCIDACCWCVRKDVAAILIGSLCESVRGFAHTPAKHWPCSTPLHVVLEILRPVLLLGLPVLLHIFVVAAVLQFRLWPVMPHTLLAALVPMVGVRGVRAHILTLPCEAEGRSTSRWLDHARCGNVSQHVAIVLIVP